MPFRVWVGFWTGLFILLIVAFDLSALVRYITRFTEESFACLIALIFIYEAFKKTFEIEKHSPVYFHPPEDGAACYCLVDDGGNITTETPSLFTTVASLSNFSNVTETASAHDEHMSAFAKACMLKGGTLQGDCGGYVPDVFFFSLLLFFGTFFLANTLVHFRHSLFFPTFVSMSISSNV